MADAEASGRIVNWDDLPPAMEVPPLPAEPPPLLTGLVTISVSTPRVIGQIYRIPVYSHDARIQSPVMVYCVLRHLTYEEWLETNPSAAALREPRAPYYYEVSID